MPNWCECDLWIKGDPKDIQLLLDTIKSDRYLFDFDKVIPYPESFKAIDKIYDAAQAKYLRGEIEYGDLPRDGFNSGGCEWCCKNWGTKWNPRLEPVNISSIKRRQVKITFATAWSPPIAIIAKLSALFPQLTFILKYYECGCQYAGSAIYINGQLTGSTYREDYHGQRGG